MEIEDQCLPPMIRDWLVTQHWRVHVVEPLVGGFAARLFRMDATTPAGERRYWIYKHLAHDRKQELTLYSTVLHGRSDLIPEIVVCLSQGDETGILMADCGLTLKHALALQPSTGRLQLLASAVTWLADLHIRCEGQLLDLVASGLTAAYPVHSSISWADFALVQLQWIADDQLGQGLLPMPMTKLQEMRDWFYPRYTQWLCGRVTLTHGDPHHENMICAQGAFRLIDWEATCVAVPQRDLAIFLQDVLDGSQHEALSQVYQARLRSAGWDVDDPDFRLSFAAVFFDNTLMMLGWEIHKYRQGYLTQPEILRITRVKLCWLQTSFAQLQHGLPE